MERTCLNTALLFLDFEALLITCEVYSNGNSWYLEPFTFDEAEPSESVLYCYLTNVSSWYV